jgi:molybdopterin converting factor small subunit
MAVVVHFGGGLRGMAICIELYGIPRQRAGVSRTFAEGARLDEVLADLAARFPSLADACFAHGTFRDGYLANLNGDRFVSDPATTLAPGDSLLILSADAGG